ncbi:hypothetical protein EMCRGX_G026272 [Ephydatia muelleri]
MCRPIERHYVKSIKKRRVYYGQMKTFRCMANQGDDDDGIVKHKLATTAVRDAWAGFAGVFSTTACDPALVNRIALCSLIAPAEVELRQISWLALWVAHSMWWEPPAGATPDGGVAPAGVVPQPASRKSLPYLRASAVAYAVKSWQMMFWYFTTLRAVWGAVWMQVAAEMLQASIQAAWPTCPSKGRSFDGVSGAAFPCLHLWCLLLSDVESSEPLDLAELLVDSGNNSDDVLDEWRRERLLTVDHADVGSCSVVQVGSPTVGLQTSHQPLSLLGSGGEYASASPLAGVWLLVANQQQGDGPLAC